MRICPKISVKLNSSGLKVFGLDHFGLIYLVRDGMCVDPSLCRGSAQVFGSSSRRQNCKADNDRKIGEVCERERVMCSVTSAARDET